MIKLEGVTKRYGDFTAVDDVSFVAQPGRVTGFLGPNGAGKSTSMGGKRLSWCRVVGIGSLVRSVQVDDRVLFDPEDKAEVEVHGEIYVVLRERDLHAVAADRLGDSPTGLYL